MSEKKRGIWVFGDYRNYFQNRVTLQLLSRARELAVKIDAEVCAVVFGHWTEEWVDDALAQNPTFCGVVQEYIAHGADKVYLTDHPRLAVYSMETYALLMERLARREKPEIILIGATTFGREFAPRLAKRLGTGLTADCIGLDINPEGLLVQTAPSFGGSLVAEIITPERRPQMATVRPGTFQEIPHDNARTGKVVKVPLPKDLPADRVRLIRSDRRPQREQKLEDAKVVVCGGRGLQSKKKFAKLSSWPSCWAAKWARRAPWSMPTGPDTTCWSARPAGRSGRRSSSPSGSAGPSSTPPPATAQSSSLR